MSERLLVSADRDVLQQQLDHHEVNILYLGCLINYSFKKALFLLMIIKHSNMLQTLLLDLIQEQYVRETEDI
jgi:hypothetical protein